MIVQTLAVAVRNLLAIRAIVCVGKISGPVQSSFSANSGPREAIMDSKGTNRRRFLTQTAAVAGVAAGAGLVSAKGQTPQAPHVHTEPPRRGAQYSIDHMTHYTPLQDYQ